MYMTWKEVSRLQRMSAGTAAGTVLVCPGMVQEHGCSSGMIFLYCGQGGNLWFVFCACGCFTRSLLCHTRLPKLWHAPCMAVDRATQHLAFATWDLHKRKRTISHQVQAPNERYGWCRRTGTRDRPALRPFASVVAGTQSGATMARAECR